MEQKRKSISPLLRKMEINDTEAFPIDRMLVVKSTATLLGAQMKRGYSTSIVRDKGVILITRTA